jgi:hypothetical protein
MRGYVRLIFFLHMRGYVGLFASAVDGWKYLSISRNEKYKKYIPLFQGIPLFAMRAEREAGMQIHTHRKVEIESDKDRKTWYTYKHVHTHTHTR